MRAAFTCSHRLSSYALRRPTIGIFSVRHGLSNIFSLRWRFGTPSTTSYYRLWPRRSAKFGTLCVGSLTTVTLIATSSSSSTVLAQEPKQEEDRTAAITVEQQMLDESERQRKEARSVPENLGTTRKIIHTSHVFILDYIVEPVATGVRFITLVFIFSPVVFTMPIIYFGMRLSHKSRVRKGTLWWYGFLIRSLERAGPTFIKLGQWAASRSDIFPTELCEMMSKLHSNAKAHSLRATKRTISHAFGGRKFEDIFEEFDETPLGVGAVAQVYKAKVKPDLIPPTEVEEKNFRRMFREKVDGLVKMAPGQQTPSSYVAIKVLHPRMDKIVNRDLRIMRFFAVLLNAVPTLEWLSFPDEVDTFSNMMRLQMDLRIEAENLAKFRSNFKNRTTVTFPVPYRDYTTRDVLIEEFAHGMPLEAFLECGGGNYQQEMANMGLDAFLHMLVMDNFIHSDLHPGNIMIRFLKPTSLGPVSLLSRVPFFAHEPQGSAAAKDHDDATTEVCDRLNPHRGNKVAWTAELARLDDEGYRPQLVFIDAGLVTELNSRNRRNFLDLFRAIAEFDGYLAGQLMIARSRVPQAVLEGDIFALKMQHLVLAVKSRTLALGSISFGDILSEVLQMVRTHHVRMEGDFVNVVLSMLLLEGIGRSLDPNVDLLKSSLPMLRAVGAGAGSQMLHKSGGGTGGGFNSSSLSFLKVWIALETRQWVTSSIDDIENLVKYDLLSPNV